MDSFVCGKIGPPLVLLRALEAMRYCCFDAVEDGPSACSCWEPEYDVEQMPPHVDEEPGTAEKMCDECAYRPGSPERNEDERYTGLAPVGQVFWCHRGMRKAARFRHPTAGLTVEADTDGYEPPQRVIDGVTVPFQADGSPGLRCAGWAAHQAALAAQRA